jgi:hypothetical protein
MDLVEIEKGRQPLAGPGRTKKRPTPRVDSTRMQLDTESRMGIPPVFFLKASESTEKMRDAGPAARQAFASARRQRAGNRRFFAARQTCAEVREKTGSYLGLGGSGAKKGLQVMENTRRGDVIAGAGCGASETVSRCHNAGQQKS